MTGLRAHRSSLGLNEQVLWLCRWGTQTALVWAQSSENADLRVRHGAFDRRLTLDGVTARPKSVHGAVATHRATAADIEAFAEAGGKVPA